MLLGVVAPVAPAAANLTPWQAVVLGAVQGVSEPLPISSSAHLYIVPELLGWRYEGVAFDVALHWGTLLALLAAFWRVWLDLARGLFGRGPDRENAWGTVLRLAVATVPGAVLGVLLEKAAEEKLRALPLQAAMLVVFGLLLWLSDHAPTKPQKERFPGWGPTLIVGFAQALALVPGVSRSGITITAGRTAGLDRVTAARLSFLLATPITFGAGLVELRHLPHDLPAATLAAGMISAAVVGLASIRACLWWLARAGFGVFFAYRVAVAGVILVWLALH